MATSLRFAMNTWTEETVGCRWKQWEFLFYNQSFLVNNVCCSSTIKNINFIIKLKVKKKCKCFRERPPHVPKRQFHIFVRMSWNLAISTRLINSFLLSWIHLEMGNFRNFLIKNFWWATQLNSSVQIGTPGFGRKENQVDGWKYQICLALYSASCRLSGQASIVNVAPNRMRIRSFFCHTKSEIKIKCAAKHHLAVSAM